MLFGDSVKIHTYLLWQNISPFQVCINYKCSLVPDQSGNWWQSGNWTMAVWELDRAGLGTEPWQSGNWTCWFGNQSIGLLNCTAVERDQLHVALPPEALINITGTRVTSVPTAQNIVNHSNPPCNLTINQWSPRPCKTTNYCCTFPPMRIHPVIVCTLAPGHWWQCREPAWREVKVHCCCSRTSGSHSSKRPYWSMGVA